VVPGSTPAAVTLSLICNGIATASVDTAFEKAEGRGVDLHGSHAYSSVKLYAPVAA